MENVWIHFYLGSTPFFFFMSKWLVEKRVSTLKNHFPIMTISVQVVEARNLLLPIILINHNSSISHMHTQGWWKVYNPASIYFLRRWGWIGVESQEHFHGLSHCMYVYTVVSINYIFTYKLQTHWYVCVRAHAYIHSSMYVYECIHMTDLIVYICICT